MEDFGYAEDEMAVRNCLDHFLAEPFPKFHDPLLVARWAEVPTLARKCQKILMAAVSTFHTSKPIVQDTAIKIPVNNLSHITPEKAILPFKALFIGLLKSLEIYPVKCRFAALLWRI